MFVNILIFIFISLFFGGRISQLYKHFRYHTPLIKEFRKKGYFKKNYSKTYEILISFGIVVLNIILVPLFMWVFYTAMYEKGHIPYAFEDNLIVIGLALTFGVVLGLKISFKESAITEFLQDYDKYIVPVKLWGVDNNQLDSIPEIEAKAKSGIYEAAIFLVKNVYNNNYMENYKNVERLLSPFVQANIREAILELAGYKLFACNERKNRHMESCMDQKGQIKMTLAELSNTHTTEEKKLAYEALDLIRPLLESDNKDDVMVILLSAMTSLRDDNLDKEYLPFLSDWQQSSKMFN